MAKRRNTDNAMAKKKKDKQYNDQKKDKRWYTKTTQKTKNRATRNPLKTGGKFR